ncbi:MAG: hypothetical protein PHU56_03890 [Candidatus Pacebacteria bacterium]|nr:hypothetical protein [Candidatus Paceibacterota bacterium]
MLSLILFFISAASLGGLVFLAVHKIPVLTVVSSAVPEETDSSASEMILAREKFSLLSRKLLIFIAQKAIFLLRALEKFIQGISEKARRFYHHQKKREDIQAEAVKKQEEIAQNSDYWHVISHALHGRKKKERVKD